MNSEYRGCFRNRASQPYCRHKTCALDHTTAARLRVLIALAHIVLSLCGIKMAGMDPQPLTHGILRKSKWQSYDDSYFALVRCWQDLS